MKTKIKHHSRSALAVILTLCLLVSCMTVGLIATDAAIISGNSKAVGAQTDIESVGTVASGSTLIVNSGCYGNTTLYAYFYGGTVSTDWVSLTRITSGNFEGKYYCTVPAGSPTNVIICKMNGNGSGWNNRLNQTDDASLSGNYVIVSSSWGSSSSNVDGKDYKKEAVSVSAKEFKVFVRNGSSNNHSVEESYFLTNDNGSGVFSITTPSIVAADTHFEVKNYNYNNGGTDVYYGKSGNYWLDNTVVGNSYTVTASVDIKNVSTSSWTGSTFSKTLVSSNSSYSLTGDIWSSCVTQINGSANNITRGNETDAQWWGSYHSDAAIGTSTGNAGEYYIDITTADRATLVAGNPTFTTIDIGLYNNSENKQKAFKVGDTYYNYIGGDYKVTSAGLTDADIVDLAASNGGGSLQLQPGRTYRITVNENTSKISVSCTSGDKYFLAGQYSDGSTQFFGEKWNTANNELVYNSSTGKYELEFTSDIPAGTISFKTVKNGDSDGWNAGSWPTGNNNQTYVINANATKVKFSFDASNHTMTVTQENGSSGGGGSTGWLYSKTAPAERTEVNPISGWSSFDASTTGNNQHGKFRFMYGTSDTGLNTAKTPTYYYDGTNGKGYWADITSTITHNSNYYFGLCNYSNQGNLVGNNSEEINDATYDDGTDVTIKDDNNHTLFEIQRKSNNSVSGSAKYILIHDIDWDRVSAIGVRAWDNSKSTNNSNNHTGKVDYQFYYKAVSTGPVVVNEVKTVDIYAKNGTLRDSNFNRLTNLANTEILDYFEYKEKNSSTGEETTYSSISTYNDAHDDDIAITHDESYGSSNYDKIVNVPVGATIKLRTYLSGDTNAEQKFQSGKAFKDTHYLKAYSFNGVSYDLHTKDEATTGDASNHKFVNADEYYEETWTVRDVNTTYKDSNGDLQNATTGGRTIEVTPIYYMKDNTNCKTFYIDGYDGEVQNAWGNMLCVYPYYENISGKNNAFGGYPGQPMLYYGGKYQMEIPLTVDGTASGATVKGLTLHNGYWDLFHRSKDIRCNARNHAQTYDYDDFYKLNKEKNPDTIIFDFKYRTAHDNYGDGYQYTKYNFAGDNPEAKAATTYAGSGYNGVELVTDYFGRQVDVFGTLIKDADQSDYDDTHPQDKELLIVSTGYKDTYVGEYATIWAVYAPQSSIPSGSSDTAGKFIGYISSSMLYLNNIDRRLQYTDGDNTSSGRMSWSNFVDTYNHLKTYYKGVPALISYEKEIWNDSKDKANRSDGKWYYSNKSDKVTASIKIQYGSHTLMDAPDHSVSSSAWYDDPFGSETGVGGYNNIGTSTGCSAYFTNTSPNLLGKVNSGEQFADSTKSFTFQAVASGSYLFAGWVRYSNGKYYEITDNEIGKSPMSANDVYIARFVDAQTGSLTIQHVVEQTNTFNGTGTPSVTVTVKDGSTTKEEFTSNSGQKLDISKWIDSHFNSYTIDISLTTTPTEESFMKEIVSSSGNYAPASATWNADKTPTNSSGADTNAKTVTIAQFTVQNILSSGVTSLRYVSHLMKPQYTYDYEITYTYTSRFWGTQSYTQTGTCEEGDFTGSKTTAKLTKDFIISKTPYEKNFRQQINWNYTTTAVPAASGTGNVGASAMENNVATDQGSNTYKMTAHVYASKTVNDKVTAEFVLPYKYNEKAQGYTAKDTDVYTDNDITGKTYLYDTGNESVSLSAKAYNLFTYDDLPHTGSDDTLASGLPLMEAAPYLMTNLGDNDYHYKLTDNMRYYTGKSFKVGNTTYYLSQDDVPQNPGTYEVLTASDSVTFTKIKYAGTDHTTTYHFAVEDTSGGARGQYGYKIYFFSYVTDDFGNYVDNEGHSVNSPIFNGQYCVYSVGREKDGIIEGKGSKKYFTRWDIYNTKGDFVASCYNRRFNFSGYDNYVIKPVYDSDTEQNYASSAGLDNTTLANITYLGDTRNQWNNGAKGDYATVTGKTDGNTAGDKLIHDFALAYAYNGLEISKVPSSTPIKIGMIIEQLDTLDSAGGTKITDSSYYAEKYNKSSDAHRPEVDMPKIKTLLEGKTDANPSTYLGHTCINSKIGNNVDDNWGQKFGSTLAKNSPTNIMSFDSVIDNFNRLQWFYTFNNTKTGGVIGDGNNANFAYRAWSYIIVGGTATVSSTPAYFTLYDSAHR